MSNYSQSDMGLFWAQTFAKGITDAVVIIDNTGQIKWFNRAAEKFFTLKHQYHGQNISEIFSTLVIQEYLRQDKLMTLELPLPKQADTLISAALIPYGSHYLLVTQNAGYRQEVDRMRQDFVANVSHEMRTPLTVIRGCLEMIEPDLQNDLPQWSPFVEQMQQQVDRLQNLIEELLLLSKLQSHNVDESEVVRVNMEELLNQVVADAKRLSQGQHQFVCRIQEGVELLGSEKELLSCFTNLVFNAVRYSPDGGKIRVAWYQNDTGKHFYIKDQGIGIEQKHISRLTERFYRVDKGRSRQTGGTGLGLAIVKHILIRHKASLTIQSELGKGSMFHCDFPL